MDADRFDHLTCHLSEALNRRHLSAVLTVLGLGLTLADPSRTSAKKKKGGRKNNKKKCKNGTIKCGKACVNPRTNAQHCGGCGQRCETDRACVNGACQAGGCPGSQTRCGSLCVDLNDDEAHCGNCDNACTGDVTCIGGQCLCAAGTKCGNDCVDTQTDDDHCGSCNHPCTGGTTCEGGQCRPPSTCSPACRADQICENGQCRCPIGLNECPCVAGDTNCHNGVKCVDLNTDIRHCGLCGDNCCSPLDPTDCGGCRDGRCCVKDDQICPELTGRKCCNGNPCPWAGGPCV
jgi:hypothetical protein